MHGASLVRAFGQLSDQYSFYGQGGQHLKAAGVDLLFDLEHQSLMGITEVLRSLRKVYQTLSSLKKNLKEERPSAIVLIDYPDFNFRLAKAASKLGIPVFYYISPQLWAWRKGRIKIVKRFVDQMAVVFPFEVEFYQSHGVDARFVGHPLLDVLPEPIEKKEAKAQLGLDPSAPLLGLLPGSRKTEIDKHLIEMLEGVNKVKNNYPDLNIALAQADTLDDSLIAPILAEQPFKINVVKGKTHLLQNAADLVLTVSGTAALETALMLTPMIVIYRVTAISHFLAKMLVDVDHIAMPNLIAGERLVPELLQNEVNADTIAAEIKKIFDQPELVGNMLDGLKKVREKLGDTGASANAARLLLDTIESGESQDGMSKI